RGRRSLHPLLFSRPPLAPSCVEQRLLFRCRRRLRPKPRGNHFTPHLCGPAIPSRASLEFPCLYSVCSSFVISEFANTNAETLSSFPESLFDCLQNGPLQVASERACLLLCP